MSSQNTVSPSALGKTFVLVLMCVLPWFILGSLLHHLWDEPSLTLERLKLAYFAVFIIWSVMPHLLLWLKDHNTIDRATQRGLSTFLIRTIPKQFAQGIFEVLAFFVLPVLVLSQAQRREDHGVVLTGFWQKYFGPASTAEDKPIFEASWTSVAATIAWFLKNRCGALREAWGFSMPLSLPPVVLPKISLGARSYYIYTEFQGKRYGEIYIHFSFGNFFFICHWGYDNNEAHYMPASSGDYRLPLVSTCSFGYNHKPS